jgi:hypothetical protein
MAHNASTLNSTGNHSSNPPQSSMNMQHLTHAEAIELLQIGAKRFPDFAVLVSMVVSKADERARLESLKPPPPVDYMSLRSAFHRTLHSLDRLRPSQQFEQLWRLSSELEPLIKQVGESVNQNSPRETVEAAFICLQKFASQTLNTDYEICKGLTRDGVCTLSDISEVMVKVGTLLKAKGGPVDKEIREKIEYLADGGEDGFEEYSFPEVLRIVWGEGEESESDEGNGSDEEGDGDEEDEDEYEDEENAADAAPHGLKRSYTVMDGSE